MELPGRPDVSPAEDRNGQHEVREFPIMEGGGPIAVARRGGHTATLQEMLMFFFINDMIVPGSTYWNMAFGLEPGEVEEDREGIETIRRFGDNVAKLIRKIND